MKEFYRGRVLRITPWAVVLGLMIVSFATLASADARTDYLIQSLNESSTFRVRAQAALALGQMGHDTAVVAALNRALGSDPHPAVRAAVITALDRIGDKSSVAMIKRSLSDNNPTVRGAAQGAIAHLSGAPSDTGSGVHSKGGFRYYIAVGPPSSKVQVARGVLDHVRASIETELNKLQGVGVAPTNESLEQASAILRYSKATGYYIDSSIVRITEANGMLRVEISMIVSTYPGRDIRMMLSGAAAGDGDVDSEDLKKQLVQVAAGSAMRRFGQTLDSSKATRITSAYP